MGNTAEAIRLVLALTSLAQRSIEAANRANEAIARADEEGREISADELAEIREERERKLAEWREGMD